MRHPFSGNRAALVVLDGWGIAEPAPHNALHVASTPCVDHLSTLGTTRLRASGPPVGLLPDQPGNSQAGHLTIGAGRAVPQDLTRIDESIDTGRIARGPLGDAYRRAQDERIRLHLVAMVSTGGVHSHLRHTVALLDLASRFGLSDRTFVHAVTDGRDVSAHAAETDLPYLENRGARIATVSGRNHAMDRAGRWERTRTVVAAVIDGQGARADTALQAVRSAYQRGLTDQDIEPTVVRDAVVHPDDEVVFANFRPDGLRQLTRMMLARGRRCTTLTRYDPTWSLPVAVDSPEVPNTLGDVIAEHGMRQLRVAEQEKFGHVTYFFDGYREVTHSGRDRVCVPSRTEVPSYDQCPAMSADAVTAQTIRAIESGYDFVVTNFANTDTVAHTGNFVSAVEAAETVDGCLHRLLAVARDHDVEVLICADHGNAERMVDHRDQTPHTRHTDNPVPCWLVGRHRTRSSTGTLADIAPTCLDLMGLPVPQVMTGTSLLADHARS